MTAAETTCAVCGGHEADPALLSRCFECGATFHLNPYSDRPGIDCGDAVIGPSMGVYFLCRPCLDAIDREAREAMGGSEHDRAAAMAQAMLGSGFAPPPPTPASRVRPQAPRPARRRPRRRYRRIDQP
ncbi:MAG TPA: hypothetical protein VFG79_16050 [Solirubrobacter sp.]|nr:hypothetical protein [Solirubrobacter sp.]